MSKSIHTFPTELYQNMGIGQRIGFGERPALVIVDYMECTRPSRPIGFPEVMAGIAATKVLLQLCREARLPIMHIHSGYLPGDAGRVLLMRKIPALSELLYDSHDAQIVAELQPIASEGVIQKQNPSAFFETPLAAWLNQRNVDTVLVAGNSTSGCVRATVVDSCSYNFRTIVVAECVVDRAHGPHIAALFDMDQKFADVVELKEVQRQLQH